MTREINIRLNANRAKAVNTGHKFASGDKGITFKITVDELDTTNTTAKIVFKKSNGASVEADITAPDDVYTYKTLGNEFSVIGPVVADVKFYSEDTRVSTCTFLFEVVSDTMDGLNAGTGGYSDTLERMKESMAKAESEMVATEKEMEELSGQLTELYNEYEEMYGNTGVLNPRGIYLETEIYTVRDVVSYNDATWICRKNCTGATPSKESECWQYFAVGADLEDIISGAQQVGNAKNLDGHKAEYFAPLEKTEAIQSNQRKYVSVEGWYRVATIEGTTASLPNSVFIRLGNGYSSGGCSEIILLFSKANVLSGFDIISAKTKNTLPFSRVRCVASADNTTLHIEAYYTLSVNNICAVTTLGFSDVRSNAWKAVQFEATEETVDGFSVIASYNIPSNARVATDLDLENYMPLTGGIVHSTNIGALSVRRDGATGSAIKYENADKVLGYLGIGSSGKPLFFSADLSTEKELLHTGNMADYVLPLTGGKISKASFEPLLIENTQSDASSVYVRFLINGVNKGQLGVSSEGSPIFYSGSEGKSYNILYTGNKPTGTYTGNGDATARQINTGGIGNALLVWGGGYGAIVYPDGAIIMDGTTVTSLPVTQCSFDNGKYTVATTNAALNANGSERRYRVL